MHLSAAPAAELMEGGCVGLTDLFSRRGKPPPSSVTYDNIPEAFRHQAVMIVRDAVGGQVELLEELGAMLIREHPVPSFSPQQDSYMGGRAPPVVYQCIAFGSTTELLDAVELGFRAVNTVMRTRWENSGRDVGAYKHFNGTKQTPDDAIQELNTRFAQHGLGYAFSAEANQLVRMDSQFTQNEIVEPAWHVLHELGFDGPVDEFRRAHKYFRQGDAKDAATWAVKALESTAKAICDERRWKYDKNRATAKPLLDLLFKKGLVPSELESHFGGLRAALESGLPTIGNAHARHGQGSKRRDMEDSLAALAMHLCAASILFLCQAHKATR